MNESELIDAIERAAKTVEKRVNVSLDGVSYMSSGMITSLVSANKYAQSMGVDVRFVNVSPNVMEVFKITKLNKLFRVEGETQ